MSIFLSSPSQKPPSYTKEFGHTEHKFAYNDLKKDVRTNVVDRFSSFDKLGGNSSLKPSNSEKTFIKKNSSGQLAKFVKKDQSPIRQSPSRKSFGQFMSDKFQNNNSSMGACQTSPAKINGIQKKILSIGSGLDFTKRTSPQKIQAAQVPKSNDTHSFYHSFMSPQQKTGVLLNPKASAGFSSGNSRSGFGQFGQSSQQQSGGNFNKASFQGPSLISSSVPIQKLVEIQNMLELTPGNELSQLPRKQEEND